MTHRSCPQECEASTRTKRGLTKTKWVARHAQPKKSVASSSGSTAQITKPATANTDSAKPSPDIVKSTGRVGHMGNQHENLLTAIDVGSAKTCVLVAEVTDCGLRYRGHGMAESRGSRKGVIVELEKAVASIQKAVEGPKISRACRLSTPSLASAARMCAA